MLCFIKPSCAFRLEVGLSSFHLCMGAGNNEPNNDLANALAAFKRARSERERKTAVAAIEAALRTEDIRSTDALAHSAPLFETAAASQPDPECESTKMVAISIDDLIVRFDPACAPKNGGVSGLTKIAAAMAYTPKQAEHLIYTRQDATFFRAGAPGLTDVTTPGGVPPDKRGDAWLWTHVDSGTSYGIKIRGEMQEQRRQLVPGWKKKIDDV